VSAELPGAELFLLLGADAYSLFDQWRDPEGVRALATIVVLVRGDGAPVPRERPGVRMLQSRRVDISSTELRARVRDGRTIRGFVPDAVADYIAEHRLYR
jgi:nicotinate-nucleotide adenylyltransferase